MMTELMLDTCKYAPSLVDHLVGASKQRGFGHGRFSGSATGQTFNHSPLGHS